LLVSTGLFDFFGQLLISIFQVINDTLHVHDLLGALSGIEFDVLALILQLIEVELELFLGVLEDAVFLLDYAEEFQEVVRCLNGVLVDPCLLARGVNGWGISSSFKRFKQSKLLLKGGYLNLQGFNLILQEPNLFFGIYNRGPLLLQLYLIYGPRVLRLLLYRLHLALLLIKLLQLLLDLPVLRPDLLPGLSPHPLIHAPHLIQRGPVCLAVPPGPGILELHHHGLIGFVHLLELRPDALELTRGTLLELPLQLLDVLSQLAVLIGELLIQGGKLVQLRVM
jgi:hypothetical protein